MENVKATINLGSSCSGTTILDFNKWGEPELIGVSEVGESVVMLYMQTSRRAIYTDFRATLSKRVFKIVFSCIDGKWNKSEPILGKIIPAQEEQYEFEN
jgi:hypothetical protein